MRSTDHSELQSELPKQPDMVAIFTLIGMTITGVMSLIGFYNQDFLLASILLGSSLLYLVIFYLYHKHNKKRLVSSVVIYSLHSLMYYLVYTGGVDSTGILWLFIIAPVTIYIHGLKRGAAETIGFLAIVAVLMNLPPPLAGEYYKPTFQIRFFLSFLTVSFLSALYEYSRNNWYKHTLALTEKYQRLALKDPLTQLSNRRHALHLLEQEQSRLERSGDSACILLCDIDHFKQINDEYGHNAGDQVLAELAHLFNTVTRKHDTVARWGGEEFIFILPYTDIESAKVTAEKLRQVTKNHTFYFDLTAINVTISIGIEALCSTAQLDHCIHIADQRLYLAKSSGRDQICVGDEPSDTNPS